jgi:diadenosine tetraphosphate (Ap4A) HIT family hydrolase
MDEACAFCVDEQSLAGGLHPQVPLALVWADSTWRLFADLTAESSGFCLLAPRRHVATVPQLEPGEVSSLGTTLARLMRTLQSETGAEAVYLYLFDHPHLHFHLAPHKTGDALSSQIVKGGQVTQQTGGLQWATSAEFPPLPREMHLQIASRVRGRLTAQPAR